jgi:putative aldouronate transport system permease protein
MQAVSRRNRKILWKSLRRYWMLYLLLAPAAIYILIFCYQPMYGVIIAFKDFQATKGILGSPWAGLDHFIRFVTYPNFGKLLWNTVALNLYGLATFPVPIVFALSLNEMRNARFKRVVQMATYAPNFISVVVICGMILLFFNRSMGLVNNLLESLGLTRIDFMADPKYFRHIYVWSGVWQSFGFGSIIYLAGLSGVSQELIEAARIDGASRLRINWHVNLPAITPTIILLLILSTGGILGSDFTKILLLQNDLNKAVSDVLSTYTYSIGIISGQYAYSSAIGLFNTVIGVGILLGVNAVAKKATDIGIW